MKNPAFRKIAAVAAAGIMTFSLAACGSNSTASGTSAAGSSASSASAAETSSESAAASVTGTSVSGSSAGTASGKTYKVGIVQYVDDASLNQIESNIESELDAKGKELGVTFDYSDYTYNGQARIPEMFLKKKTGVIPYGWGYNPGKIVLTDKNIAVDPVNEKYVVFKKSRSKFNEIKARYERIIGQYDREHTRIEKEYQDKATEITGERFWDEYLK